MTPSIILISMLAIWLSPTKNMVEAMYQSQNGGRGFQQSVQNPSVSYPHYQSAPPGVLYPQDMPYRQEFHPSPAGFPPSPGYGTRGSGHSDMFVPNTQGLPGPLPNQIPADVQRQVDELINQHLKLIRTLIPYLKPLLQTLKAGDQSTNVLTKIDNDDQAKVVWILLKELEQRKDPLLQVQALMNSATMKDDNHYNVNLNEVSLPTPEVLMQNLQNIINQRAAYSQIAYQIMNKMSQEAALPAPQL